MELNTINNASMNVGTSTDLNNVNKTDSAIISTNRPEESQVNSAKLDQRSNLAAILTEQIQSLSSSTVVKPILQTQMETINKVENTIAMIAQGTISHTEAQTKIAHEVANYNSKVELANNHIQRLDDLQGDSTTYFDGAAGAIPLDVTTLTATIETKKTDLTRTMEKVVYANEKLITSIKGEITNESDRLQKDSPFKEKDFGKESADFNKMNLTNLAGSVASSQANAMPIQNIKLLS